MSGGQLLLLGSPQDHRLYNSDAQPLVFVELGCPLDGDVPALQSHGVVVTIVSSDSRRVRHGMVSFQDEGSC